MQVFVICGLILFQIVFDMLLCLVLWNGERLEAFKQIRRVRQGMLYLLISLSYALNVLLLLLENQSKGGCGSLFRYLEEDRIYSI